MSVTLKRRLDQLTGAALAFFGVGSGINLATGQLALVCLAAVLGARWWLKDEDLLAAAKRWAAPAAASLAFAVACILSNVMTLAAYAGVVEATRWRPILGVLLGGLAVASLPVAYAHRCAVLFVGACALHACVGTYQAMTGAAPLANVLQVAAEKRQCPAPGHPDLFAAVGFFYNRVRLSHVLAAGAGVALSMSLLVVQRGWWLLAGAASVVGLTLTYGRAALGALVFSVVGLLVVQVMQRAPQLRVKWGLWVMGGVAAGVFLLMAVPSVAARMATTLDLSSNQDRLFLWGRGSEMAMDHAPWGTGFGGYTMVRDAYYDAVDASIQSRAMSHNLLLSLLAEAGVLGLTAWLWMWWALYAAAWKSKHVLGLAAGVGALTFHAATLAHDPLYQSECALAWGCCGALMASGWARDVAPQRC